MAKSLKRQLDANHVDDVKRAKHGEAQQDVSATGAQEEMDDNMRALAKRLAGNTKDGRDDTIKQLKAWLRSREQSLKTMQELELMQLWKGLFYSVWMSDKVPVQQELTESIAKLLGTVFKRSSNTLNLFRCFFRTMIRDWGKLDKLRLDKFFSLIRKIVRELLVYGHANGKLEKVIGLIRDEVLLVSTCEGVRLHVLDLYLNEVKSSGVGPAVDSEVSQELLSPFYIILGDPDSKPVLFEHTVKVVFCPLVVAYDQEQTSLVDAQNDALPQLNLAQVQKALFDIGADASDIKSKHRKRIYSLSTSFQKAARKAGHLAQNGFDSPHTPKAAASTEASEEDQEELSTPDTSRNLKQAFDSVSNSDKKNKATKKEKKKKAKKAKSTDNDEDNVEKAHSEPVSTPTPPEPKEAKRAKKSSKKNKKEDKESHEAAAASVVKTPPPASKNEESKTSAKKRIRWSKSTVAVDHAVSMKRTRTTPIKPAAVVSSPHTGALKVKSARKEAVSESKAPRSLKKEISLAKANAAKNAQVKHPVRLGRQRPGADSFFSL